MKNARNGLYNLRRDIGLYQREVAQRQRISLSRISKAERGKEMSIATARALAAEYDISVEKINEIYDEGVAG